MEDYLIKGFEEAALREFKFLQDEYGFSEPMFERNKMYENIGYAKGTLGILFSYDALDRWCTIYFFDASKGFPPRVEAHDRHLRSWEEVLLGPIVIDHDYYSRYEGLPPYNPKKLNLTDPHQKNGLPKHDAHIIGVKNAVDILRVFFDPILKTDTFIYERKAAK